MLHSAFGEIEKLLGGGKERVNPFVASTAESD
jgi:hypothetical protein